MLEVQGAGFRYRGRPVLRSIHAKIGPGELVCVVGANGAGKTTLLRLLAGLLEPSEGTVRCNGHAPSATKRSQLARTLCYLPQEYRVAFPFSVQEIVLMGRYAHASGRFLRLESAADIEASRRAMEQCDVLHLAQRRFDQLSGGERRRTLLAQAFCQATPVILLDEPTAALDPAHGIAVFRALDTACKQRNACAIAVTHDLNLAARFGHRMLLIADQTIASDGPPADVLSSQALTHAFGRPMHVGRLPDTESLFVVPQ